MRITKRVAVRGPLTALICCCIVGYATVPDAAADKGKGKRRHSLDKGIHALQFEIENDFDLSSFQGSTISFKKHTSDHSAYRVGLSTSFSSSDQTRDQYENGESVPYARETKTNSFSATVNLQKVFYRSPASTAIHLFYGLGPKLGFSHSGSDSRIDSSPSAISDRHSDRDAWTFGLSGVLGVEWFASRDISFLAEYGSALQYDYSKRTDEQTIYGQTTDRNLIKEKSDGFSLNSSAVKFGLSAYF